MPAQPQPTILFLDDVEGDVNGIASLCEDAARVLKRSFDDIEPPDLDSADLIMVDFNLNNWEKLERITDLALKPWDGLAVAENLRSYYRQKKLQKPVAIAVLSGNLNSLTDPFPPTRREHMIASLAKVEWAFEKGKDLKDMARQVLSLAEGVRQLPPRWPHDSAAHKNETLHNLLIVPDAPWSSAAIMDVARCHPPVQELSTWSHGLAFLRWMLQRILPYPTFLLDSHQVAVRLGIDSDSFCAGRNNNNEFGEWLAPTIFTGVLHDFRHTRFWRTAVDFLIWEATLENPFDRATLSQAVLRKLPDAQTLNLAHPVVTVAEDYTFAGVAEASDCVRLRPDDWPTFADSAWAQKTLVRDHEELQVALEYESDRQDLGGVGE